MNLQIMNHGSPNDMSSLETERESHLVIKGRHFMSPFDNADPIELFQGVTGILHVKVTKKLVVLNSP